MLRMKKMNTAESTLLIICCVHLDVDFLRSFTSVLGILDVFNSPKQSI